MGVPPYFFSLIRKSRRFYITYQKIKEIGPIPRKLRFLRPYSWEAQIVILKIIFKKILKKILKIKIIKKILKKKFGEKILGWKNFGNKKFKKIEKKFPAKISVGKFRRKNSTKNFDEKIWRKIRRKNLTNNFFVTTLRHDSS